ncbi:hypothetical protein HG536_0A03950 [Torulaspora globosa]|uniref:Hap4 transcription factor heteromerisation domain-containing protein n=1 Tax=Torulaspora globosa TaxID=48254 RepID=A0A7G3ZAP1_9SACH|nr:uncharacterized protein HG536_0A03950 [Torulaspora globosa]QLL30577.1 hypothetical protein HG536_0A03950 [Torulaspora globosa]
MSSTKPLPIQPYPAAIAPQLSAAHNGTGATVGARKNGGASSSGLTIRTSRHWVLPPRPKPGRKPNHYDSKRSKQAAAAPPQPAPVVKKSVSQPVCVKKELASVPIKKSATAPACLTKKQVQPSPAKKQTKTALKKEIQHIKVENSKLKQELSQLVSDLQALKQRYNSPEAASTKKRQFLDDSTSAFLKFEEDERNEDLTQLPPLLVSTAKMKFTSSVSSCKTIPTDDEDMLTVSSSTPNSLISADLQHSSSSVSSASSLNLNPGQAHGLSPTIHAKPQLKFLDDHEQMQFYDKYMRMDFSLAPHQHIDENHLAALDSIKEEETEFKFGGANDDDILSFLENKHELAVQQDSKDDQCFFAVKQETREDDADFLLQQPVANDTISTTISNSTTSNFYMPPSLEELMEEQDGGSKNFPLNLTTNDFNYYEDNLDMLKMEAFDMI